MPKKKKNLTCSDCGTLNCYLCMISDNQTGPVGLGGGIYTTDVGNRVTLVDSSVAFNSAALGGGIYSDGGTLTVIGTMAGGGLVMSLDLAYNTAASAGGGLYQTGSGAKSTFDGAGVIANSTNGGGADIGGGCCLDGGSASFTDFSWVAGNWATLGTAIAYQNPGANWSKDLTSQVTGSIYVY